MLKFYKILCFMITMNIFYCNNLLMHGPKFPSVPRTIFTERFLPVATPIKMAGQSFLDLAWIIGRQAHRRRRRIETVKDALVADCHWTKRNMVKLSLLVAVWSAVIAVGTYLTIMNCIDLINQYLEEKKTTTLSLQINQSMAFPLPVTLCLPMEKLYTLELWYAQIYDAEIYTDPERSNKLRLAELINGGEVTRDFFFGDPVQQTNRWPNFIIKTVDIWIKSYEEWLSSYIRGSQLPNEFIKLNVTVKELKQQLNQQLSLAENNASSTQFQNAVEDIFRTPNFTKETFLKREKESVSWKPSKLFIMLTCLNMVTRLENGATGLENYHFNGNPRLDVEKQLADKKNACIALERHLRRFDITTDELRQKFGDEIFRLFAVDVEFLSEIVRTTVVSSAEVCYKLTTKSFRKSQKMTVSLLEVDMRRLPGPRPPQYWDCGRARLALDFSGRERNVLAPRFCLHESLSGYEATVLAGQAKTVRRNDAQKAFAAQLITATDLTVDVAAVYRYLPKVKGQQQCFADRTVYDCFRDCKVALIEKHLNCTPSSLTLLSLADRDRECSIETLNQWRYEGFQARTLQEEVDVSGSAAQFNHSEEIRCNANCLNSCEDWHIMIQESIPEDVTSKWNEIFVHIAFGSYEYTVYEEAFAWTWESFLANMGGILGLYLGINMVMVAEILITLSVFAYKFYMRLNRQRQNDNEIQLKNMTPKSADNGAELNAQSVLEKLKQENEAFVTKLMRENQEVIEKLRKENQDSVEKLKRENEELIEKWKQERHDFAVDQKDY